MVLSFGPLWSQTEFFVDGTNGSDQNDGLSLQTAWATIQKSCDEAIPNSIVKIRGGIYHENVQVNVSGTGGNPIVFTNYPGETVIIDGEGTNGTSLIRMTNRSWLHFENLELRNLVRNNARGIMVETSQNGYARNLSFKNINIHGIRFTAEDDVIPASGQNARGFVVSGRGGGIEYLTIQDCEIHHNVTGKSEALTLNGNIEDFLIEGCDIYDNTNIGICLAGNYGVCNDPLLDKARNGIVRNNTCHGNVSPLASSAGIYVDGGENIVIERNSSYQNGTGISVGCEKNGVTQFITVKNNMIYDNLGRGLAVGGYTMLTTGEVLYSTFRNNTLYQNNSELGYASEIHVSKASQCVFEDNIVFSNDQNIVLSVEAKFPQANNLFNYNCLYTPSGNASDLNIYWHELSFAALPEFQQALGQEINSIYAHPGWAQSEPQMLAANSLCVDSGNPDLEIPAGELDFMGNPRLSGVVDIGAFEFDPQLGLETVRAQRGIYPNPLTGNLLHSPTLLSNATFRLFDMGGRQVAEIGHLSGHSIQLPGIGAGLYLYQISQDGKTTGMGKLAIR